MVSGLLPTIPSCRIGHMRIPFTEIRNTEKGCSLVGESSWVQFLVYCLRYFFPGQLNGAGGVEISIWDLNQLYFPCFPFVSSSFSISGRFFSPCLKIQDINVYLNLCEHFDGAFPLKGYIPILSYCQKHMILFFQELIFYLLWKDR